MSARRRRRRRNRPAQGQTAGAAAPKSDSKPRDRRKPAAKRGGLGRGFWAYFAIMMAVMIPLNLFCLSNVGDTTAGATDVQPSELVSSVDEATGAYATDPPTSGPFVEQLASPGYQTTTLPDPVQVANLQRGYVIVHFNPSGGSALESKMRRLAAQYEGQDVIVQPDSSLASPVVLTAWGRIDELEEFDQARIDTFIRQSGGLNHRALTQSAPTGG